MVGLDVFFEDVDVSVAGDFDDVVGVDAGV